MTSQAAQQQIEGAYKVGERIECRDPGGSGAWRPAIVASLAPYRGRPGYYITWADIDWANYHRAPWQSSGGWTFEACMRPLSDAA